jgi:hypothetical protein
MHPVPGLTAADERRRDPGAEPGWSDVWSFDFATEGAALGGFVRLTFLPHARTCWYWAWVVGDGRAPVMVVDNDVPLPPGRSLELRTEGLWADHTVEVPFDHVTLGCEAFALRLDHADDALALNPVGDRVPFGLDLEWDTDGPAQPLAADDGLTGYAIPCRVHGLVLVADEQITLDATGYRHHTWGTPTWSTASTVTGTLTDGTHLDTTFTALDPPATVDAKARHFTVEPIAEARHLTVEPIAEAPVPVPTPSPGAHPTRLVRTLCRFRDESTNHTGAGWTEQTIPT